ncbi:MAG: aspartate kinase [Acidimicrobiia bacterium]|nr:aspartate kinase [Acidimicrobiia bacterium]
MYKKTEINLDPNLTLPIDIQERLIVQKFGGTSLGTPERIKAVAERISENVQRGHSVVVVVSAMGDTTDDLLLLAKQLTKKTRGREMDMLLTAGERISMALLSMALHELKVDAISFTGSQAGVLTDTVHGKAKIVEIRAKRIVDALKENKVCVVAGFQGMSLSEESITTLGRGGSDTTAVALAAALKATACEIYTDVSGVYSADPRIVPKAKKIDQLSFDEMLEISATGGRVLVLRSVEFARNFDVPIHVRSSFSPENGTWIYDQETDMEDAIVSAVTHDISEVKFTLEGVPDKPGVAANIFRALSKDNLNIDMIVQNVSSSGVTDISFTIPEDEKMRAISTLEDISFEIGTLDYKCNDNVGRVSVVGAGMKSNPGVAAKMFETLASENINIQMISTSTIRISCVISRDDMVQAVNALHTAYELDA